MKRMQLLTSSLLLSATASMAAESEPLSRNDSSYFTLGEITVNASADEAPASGPLQAEAVLSSVDIIGSRIVKNQNVNYAWELFNRAPGVMLTNFNQGNTSGKFSFRGFNGEGEINAVKLLIDGIPSNSNDGNMPYIDAVFPLDIDRIEVVRGTNDARYGLHNIAGNANINTRIGGNYTEGRFSYGSFDTFDAQIASGVESRNLTQNYVAGYRRTSGYREHSDLEKYVGSGKWFYTPDSGRYRVGLITRWYHNEAQEPGYLTFADSRRDPTMTNAYNVTDGGRRDLGQFSAHLDVDITSDLFWTLKAYANTLDDQRWVKFSANVDQQERIANERQYGALTAMTYRPKIDWLSDFALEAGFDFQHQQNISQRYLAAERSRVEQTRDQAFDFDIHGGYVQLMVKPFDWLKLVPAMRVDQVGGRFDDLLTGDPSPINDFGDIWQPKFSAVITPLQGYSLYGNWGRTFQVGLGAGSYKIAPRVTDLGPSINDGWEVGLKFAPFTWLDGRMAYWEQVASDEVRRKLNDPTGDFTNLGQTKREGFDAQLRVRPLQTLDVWFAYSLQNAEVRVPDPNKPELRGNDIDHVPDFVFSGGIDYRPTEKLRTSLWTYMQGDYFTNPENSTARFGDYFLLNTSIAYQVHKLASLEFQIKNLTDEYWEYAWYDGTQTLHSPGDGRAFYGALQIKFDY